MELKPLSYNDGLWLKMPDQVSVSSHSAGNVGSLEWHMSLAQYHLTNGELSCRLPRHAPERKAPIVQSTPRCRLTLCIVQNARKVPSFLSQM